MSVLAKLKTLSHLAQESCNTEVNSTVWHNKSC